jgi:anti-sigma factor RsiW
MDHQPYKTWIILNPELDSSREKQLEAHLAECQDCRQLISARQKINLAFRKSPAPQPAPGFSERWLTRIKEKEQQERLRLTWILMSGLLVSLISVLTVAGLQLRARLPDLSEMLLITVHQTARWIYYFNHLWDLAEPIISVGFRIIPPAWMASAAVVLSVFLIIPVLQIMKIFLNREEAV